LDHLPPDHRRDEPGARSREEDEITPRREIALVVLAMIYSLASFLDGHVMDSLACPRVMAAKPTALGDLGGPQPGREFG
jgi:hypothetical protein